MLRQNKHTKSIFELAHETYGKVIQFIQKEFKQHSVLQLNILKSAPYAIAQGLHYDFDLLNKATFNYPMSLIIPLHEHCNICTATSFYENNEATEENLVTMQQLQRVNVNHYILFRGDLLHSGGSNDLPISHFRLHYYIAQNKSDIPSNSVFTYV